MFESQDFGSIREAEGILQRAVDRLDPEVLDPAFSRKLVEAFARIERLAAAGKTLAARQVVNSGAWRVTGNRTAAQWLARSTGSSVGQAIGVLETAQRLAELPATDRGVRTGRLSQVQAQEITSASAASPAAEAGLLKAVEYEGMAGLKERCARVRAAAAADEIGKNEIVRRSRHLRHWSDQTGAFRLDGRFTPEAGAAVLAALEPYKQRIFASARKQGRREAYEAYAADALVAMSQDSRGQADESSPRRSPPTMVHVRVDHAALLRGSTEAGEICDIPGIGPIPAATAQALSNDAFLAAIVTDGVDIKAVAHLGRTISAHLRTALESRDPVCVVPGCDEKDRLEIDHVHPVAQGGVTSLDNLARLCGWHHYLKTHQGYGLRGDAGRREWVPPASLDSPPNGSVDGPDPPAFGGGKAGLAGSRCKPTFQPFP